MATRTITKTWKVDDILTTATVTLAHPTEDYGVKESVSGNTVVDKDTVMDEEPTGIFQASFDDEINIAYTAFIKVVYSGATYYNEVDIPARTVTIPASTAVATQYEKTTDNQPPILFTYRDLIDHLRDYSGSLSQGTEQSRARNAIQSAYREVCDYHKWHYYHTLGRINLEPAQTTGTMAYDATTRIATMAGDTFPESARYWRMTIGDDDVVYKIAEYLSTTTVLMDPVLHPPETVTATSFTLWRSIYPLPGDITSLDEINNETGIWGSWYITANEWMRRERHLTGPVQPFQWTVLSDSDQFAGMAIAVWGYPESEDTLDFLYRRRARRLRFDGYSKYSSQGTATIATLTAGEADVVITPGVDAVGLRRDIVNAVFRTSDTGETEPPENEGSQNQYSEQDIIKTWTSTTRFSLRGNMTYGKLGDQFTISDPVDMAPFMLTLLKRRCEYEYEILKGDAAKATIAKNRYEKLGLETAGRDVRMIPMPQPWTSWVGAWINPYSTS
jgi:hypothetical protein